MSTDKTNHTSQPRKTVTLGINAAFHDSSAAVVVDGVVLAAAEEERFSRIEHAKRPLPFSAWDLPYNAIVSCVEQSDVGRPHLADGPSLPRSGLERRGNHRPAAVGRLPFEVIGAKAELVARCASLRARGAVIGWFQGGMEWGPRALGTRSILASPTDPAMQARLKDLEDREDFRPVAPAVTTSGGSRSCAVRRTRSRLMSARRWTHL